MPLIYEARANEVVLSVNTQKEVNRSPLVATGRARCWLYHRKGTQCRRVPVLAEMTGAERSKWPSRLPFERYVIPPGVQISPRSTFFLGGNADFKLALTGRGLPHGRRPVAVSSRMVG